MIHDCTFSCGTPSHPWYYREHSWATRGRKYFLFIKEHESFKKLRLQNGPYFRKKSETLSNWLLTHWCPLNSRYSKYVHPNSWLSVFTNSQIDPWPNHNVGIESDHWPLFKMALGAQWRLDGYFWVGKLCKRVVSERHSYLFSTPSTYTQRRKRRNVSRTGQVRKPLLQYGACIGITGPVQTDVSFLPFFPHSWNNRVYHLGHFLLLFRGFLFSHITR